MPLIYGNDTSQKHPVSKLTWVALVSDAVLVVYWAFIVWTLGEPFDRPDWVNSRETGYSILFSWGVSFFAGLITVVVAITGLEQAGDDRDRDLSPGEPLDHEGTPFTRAPRRSES